MNYLKEPFSICFDLDEIVSLFHADRKRKLAVELKENNLTWFSVNTENSKVRQMIDKFVSKMHKDKSEKELFIAMTFIGTYLPSGTKVCFPLKRGFNTSRDKILNFGDLKDAVEENTMTDFSAFLEGKGMIQYQLKIYYEELETEPLFQFIASKLRGYGNSLDNTCLLVYLSSPKSWPSLNVQFKTLHEKLGNIGIKGNGEVRISFNDGMKHNTLIQVYPELTISREIIDPNNIAGKFMYR